MALFRAGHRVVLSGRRLNELTETQELCTADKTKTTPGGETFVVQGDINEEDGVSQLFSKTVDKFGELHCPPLQLPRSQPTPS